MKSIETETSTTKPVFTKGMWVLQLALLTTVYFLHAESARAQDQAVANKPAISSKYYQKRSFENAINKKAASKLVTTLPSEKTYEALRKVAKKKRAVAAQPVIVGGATTDTPPVMATAEHVVKKPKYQSIKVRKEQLAEQDRGKYTFSEDDSTAVPLAVPDTLLLKLKQDISQEQIEALFEKYDFKFIESFETIGAIKVKTDLSRFFKPQLEDNDQNDTLLRGMVDTMNTFQADPLILSASPDVLLSDKNITNLLSPVDITVNSDGDMTEDAGWGLMDIEANQLWNESGSQDGVIFGVLDVGFRRHEDIVFIDIPATQGADNHGNHVAGIACGQHNGVGIKGVLPNCFVRPRSGVHVPVSQESGNVQQFFVQFSQVLSGLNSFITEHDDVSAYNISLGYNWVSNFGVNPDAPNSGIYRSLVQSQGEFLVSVLEILNDRGVLVFSAAGNDSTGLDDPISAQYASPFNYAAIAARSRGINNGIIVEAHDQEGKRAVFSNDNGDISCPGVNIMSSIAQLEDDNTDTSRTYASMSGTSMASPFCASAAILLKLVTDADPERIVHCMTTTGPNSSSGTPRLKLKAAQQECSI